MNLHLQNHDDVKKLIKKHVTDKGYNLRRGKAKRGASNSKLKMICITIF